MFKREPAYCFEDFFDASVSSTALITGRDFTLPEYQGGGEMFTMKLDEEQERYRGG